MRRQLIDGLIHLIDRLTVLVGLDGLPADLIKLLVDAEPGAWLFHTGTDYEFLLDDLHTYSRYFVGR